MSSEHAEQSSLITICRQWEGEYPDLALLHAIPLGGLRHKAVAAKLKAEGAKAGVPDLFLAVPRGAWAGLYLEMKWDRNTPTEKQQWWILQLRAQGYRVEVCYSCCEAGKVIMDYLRIDDYRMRRALCPQV